MKRAHRVALVLIASCLNIQAWAAPEYVTAWPRQVPVEKPDPVLGDKPFWEHWVYGKAFARRFKGFPVEKADSQLNDRINAMALRIYKTNLWQGLNPDYPEQYTCEWDVYFDNFLAIPLTGRPKGFVPRPYPKGVSGGYERLDPYDDKDKQAIKTSQPVASNPERPPLVFAAPLDGRFKRYRVREYHPELAENLALVVFSTGYECDVTAPLQTGGAHWLSLLGEHPYSREKDGNHPALWRAAYGMYKPNIKSNFDPGSTPESKGYFRVPEAFNKVALPKAALVKVLNWCIGQRHNKSDWRVNGKTISWQQMMYRCNEAEQQGRILPDPRYYPDKEGLQDFGY